MTSAIPATNWCLYLLRTAKGELYTGITTDVTRRMSEHERGTRGAKYLRRKSPLTLVYEVELGQRSLASRAEARVKRLNKADKEAIASACPGRGDLLSLLGISNGHA